MIPISLLTVLHYVSLAAAIVILVLLAWHMVQRTDPVNIR